jgi:hypothetical protein
MKKSILLFISLVSFLFLFTTTVLALAPAVDPNMCGDNQTPPQYNQPIGTSYTGGDGKVYKCENIGGLATWKPQDNVLFVIPNLSGFSNLGGILQVLLSLTFFVAGIFMFFNIIIGGISWIGSGGDPKAMQSSRGRITNAIIGLVIVVSAYAVAAIVGQVFGISIVNGFQFK